MRKDQPVVRYVLTALAILWSTCFIVNEEVFGQDVPADPTNGTPEPASIYIAPIALVAAVIVVVSILIVFTRTRSKFGIGGTTRP